MIDLHFHLAFGVDDGPRAPYESQALARATLRAGTQTVVATPHVDERYGSDPAALLRAIEATREALAEANVPLTVLSGAEIAVSRLRDLSDDELRSLSLGGGGWVLVECPLVPGRVSLERGVADVQRRGFSVLLAHPERSPELSSDPDRVRALVAGGSRCSVTASALTGRFGRAARSYAFRLLTDGLAHNIASDAHSADSRPPDILPGIARAAERLQGLGDLTSWLTQTVPEAIVRGEPVPEGPPAAVRAGRRIGWNLR